MFCLRVVPVESVQVVTTTQHSVSRIFFSVGLLEYSLCLLVALVPRNPFHFFLCGGEEAGGDRSTPFRYLERTSPFTSISLLPSLPLLLPYC
jgi:hypothetical protein